VRRVSSAAVVAVVLGASSASGTAAISCGSGAEGRPLAIEFDAAGNRPDAATVRVVGIPSRYLPNADDLTGDEWSSALRIAVAPEDPSAAADPTMPAVIGRYSVERRAIVFKPEYGFDAGRRYVVTFDPSKLPAANAAWQPAPLTSVVGLPARHLVPTTIVSGVFPSAEIVPENQLRLYLHFSAPMGRKGGVGYLRLLDETGDEIRDPFLPLDAEFWNRDRTRFTVFFDPGRQKRGILPNEEMGRSLVAGRSYTLVVSRDWLDADGMPLKEEFRRRFTVGPPDERPLDEKTWRIDAPRSGTREPLSVSFPEPLDHGLLQRALSVADASGRRLIGEQAVDSDEKRWQFIPAEAWRRGDHQLIAMTILEDMAGNRIGRAFEVDEFSRGDERSEPETVTVRFKISD
jgi:hypothetical protein